MGEHDAGFTQGSASDQPRRPEDLPRFDSSFQDFLARTFGADSSPQVELRGDAADSAESIASSHLDKLKTDGEDRQRYLLEGEIGRGGMGAILKIFDADLRRHLAMKVILAGDKESPDSTAKLNPQAVLRFLEEAQVTGQLDHPGVVPVHELGVDAEGRVYFTMRLVKGQELARVLRKLHDGDPDWNLTRVLGVLSKVCEAMSYAHDKGVVHRDLKPANVMVGRHGAVYVMDWGLARVDGREDLHDVRLQDPSQSLSVVHTDRRDTKDRELDSPLLTMDGAVLGTPYYMPPEQAGGRLEEIGPHSDVYALGAMLYHLLVGYPPYFTPGARVSPSTVLAMVLHGPPQSVRALAPKVPGELVAICERAMARDAQARYADMGELAEDLRAYLEHRVVKAYRTGALIELRKWVERNKATAASAAAAIAVAIGGLSAVSYTKSVFAEEVREQSQQVTLLAEEASKQRDASERVTDFLVAQFESLDPANSRGSATTAVQMLDNAAQSIASELASDDPQVTARLRNVVGEAYASMGLYDRAEPLLERSLSDRRARLGLEHVDTLRSWNSLLGLFMRQGRYSEADSVVDDALETARRALGDEHEVTLQSLMLLGDTQSYMGRTEEAINTYRTVLDARRRTLGENHADTLQSIMDMAFAQLKLEQFGVSTALFEDCLQRSRAILGEDHVFTIAAMKGLASSYAREHRYVDAIPLYEQTLAKSRAVRGDEHPSTLSVMASLGLALGSLRRNAESVAVLLATIEGRRKILGDQHPLVFESMGPLGDNYREMGRYVEAEEILWQCQRGLTQSVGEAHPHLRKVYIRLATLYDQWLPEVGASLGGSHPDSLRILDARALVHQGLGQPEHAEPLFIECLEKRLEVLGETHPDTLESYRHLAGLFAETDRLADAEALFEECLQMSKRALGLDDPATLKVLQHLVELHVSQARWKAAEPRARRLLGLTNERDVAFAERQALMDRIVAARDKDE